MPKPSTTWLSSILPGLLVSLAIAFVARFVATYYGGPGLLYALLFGMALHHLHIQPRYAGGIQLAARSILRIGVALLGVRITFAQILELGPQPLILVIIAVPLTILAGLWLGRRLGQSRDFSLLTSSAVAICGASAAIAVACALPKHPESERQLVFTVIAVTTLSTLAMIVYPIICHFLQFDALTAGVFLGATIHDVAQVVGAGYLLGDAAGNAATFTKLLRVAMLVPVVLIIALLIKSDRKSTESRPGVLPLFLVMFLILMVVNSMGWIPAAAQRSLIQLSDACLYTAIAAIGIKASVQELAGMGWRPLLLIVGETIFLALFAMLVLRYF